MNNEFGGPQRLADYLHGRDNNFNLLRFLAAFAVLIDHSYALVAGTPDAEPLRRSLGIALGAIAVDVFFVTSGFLVTASLLNRQDTLAFLRARILRIYPALLVMVLLCVLVIGLFFTTLPAGAYLDHPLTLRFILKNATLVGGIEFYLPGVFDQLAWKNMVNGSLWTMPYEVRMYIALAVLWLACWLFRAWRRRVFAGLILTITALALTAHLTNHFSGRPDDNFFRLTFMFFSGASYCVLRERIRLSSAVFGGALAALLASPLEPDLFFVVYDLTLAYVVLWLAYVPGGALRRFNRFGDYSYGIYIYAFPVQQTLLALIAGLSVAGLIVTSGAVTLLLAALSWHCLEQHALRLKPAAPAAPPLNPA